MLKILIFLSLCSQALGQKAVSYLVSPGQATGLCGNYFVTGTIGEPGAGVYSCGEGQIIVGFSQLVDLEVVSVPSFELIRDLIIYPNPADHFFEISGTLAGNQGEVIGAIYDVIGQFQKKILFRSGIVNQRISVQDLGPGVYTLVLSHAKLGRQVALFVKI